jgi:hypothetical protein
LPSPLEGEGLRMRGAVSRLRKNERRNDKKLNYPCMSSMKKYVKR